MWNKSSIRDTLLSRHRVFGRKEYKLAKEYLQEDEYIKHSVYGMYEGGSCILVLTNKRVIVVDRRPFFDYVEHCDIKDIGPTFYRDTMLGGILHLRMHRSSFEIKSFSDSKLKLIHEALTEERRRVAQPQGLPQLSFTTTEHPRRPKEKLLRPLRKRPRRHPGWSPHNPIMMSVMSNSGVHITKE